MMILTNDGDRSDDDDRMLLLNVIISVVWWSCGGLSCRRSPIIILAWQTRNFTLREAFGDLEVIFCWQFLLLAFFLLARRNHNSRSSIEKCCYGILIGT